MSHTYLEYFFGHDADYVIYGEPHWPSRSYWMIPGSQIED